MRSPRRKFTFALLLVAFVPLMSGCAGLDGYLPAPAPELTSEQISRLGAAVDKRLTQMLGGPYHDRALADALARLCAPLDYRVTIADRSAAEIYPLPGQRAIITRGLLAQIQTVGELEVVLEQAAAISRRVYQDKVTRALVQATAEFLSGPPVLYNPDAADIRLARIFAEAPCAGSCLEKTPQKVAVASSALPEPIKALHGLEPGYMLLARAKNFEEAGEQAKAIATYLQAASAAPDEPLILAALGMAYLRAGQQQSARRHLQQAGKLQPGYYRTQMGLGYLSLQRGEFRSARTALAASVRLLPVTENLFLLAEATEQSGDLAEAMTLYRVVAEHDRDSKLGRTAASRLPQPRGAE